MAKISTYASVTPTATDKVIGSDVDNSNATKNFTIQSISDFAATSGSVIGYNLSIESGVTSSPSAGDYIVVNIDNHVCTLPTAVGVSGKVIGIIQGIIPVACSVDTTGAETINGAATQPLAAQYDGYVFISDGSNWFIVK